MHTFANSVKKLDEPAANLWSMIDINSFLASSDFRYELKIKLTKRSFRNAMLAVESSFSLGLQDVWPVLGWDIVIFTLTSPV